VHERLVHRPFGELAELGPLHQQRVDVDAAGVQRDVGFARQRVVCRDQQQVDVGFGPDAVVRQASPEQRRQNRAVALKLRQQGVERGGELVGGSVADRELHGQAMKLQSLMLNETG
jgi:hypothetical protein